MSTPLVQTYLLDNSLTTLRAEHGIKTSAKTGDRFFSVNYDQIESKPGEMVNQCRGLVLSVPFALTEEQVNGNSAVGFTAIQARPFDRFFNLGDSNASAVNLEDSQTVFYEKLDGTLCIVYFNTVLCQWCVATRSVPLADKPMTGWDDLTFRGLFELALRDTLVRNDLVEPTIRADYAFDFWAENKLNPLCTYMFELTTPMNRIVVNYEKSTVWLLGIRNTQTGEETPVESIVAQSLGVPVCPSYKLNNLSELLDFVGSKAPFEQEGIVVRNGQDRVKVKSLAYVAYNRVRDSVANSPRAIVELILSEKLDDVMPVLEPYIQTLATKIQDGIRALFHKSDLEFHEIMLEVAGQENQRKAFALAVQARKGWMGYLMDRFLGRCSSLEDYIQKRRTTEGAYPDGLLDTLLAESAKL